jgi:anthranilate phosphoribosyltransferase
VVHGEEGLDELSVSGPSLVWEVRKGSVERYGLTPKDAGLDVHPSQSLLGGTPQENAALLRSVIEGKRSPIRDFTLLNAAAGLVAFGRASTLAEGTLKAAQAIDSGAALSKLNRFLEASNHFV